VAEFLDQHQLKIERRRIHLDEPIKALGESTVTIRIHPEVTAELRVNVTRE
jgi:large subunit ribosomal protein L9